MSHRGHFVGANMIALIFDVTTGYDYAYVVLEDSAEHRFLFSRLETPEISVMDLYRALRYELAGWYKDPKLLEQVASLQRTETQGANTKIARGQESLSANVIRDCCQSAGGLPNDLQTFDVRRYANAELPDRFPVQCLLDPEPRTMQWIVYPRRDSVAHYVMQAQTLVANAIAGLYDSGENCPLIVCGEFGWSPESPMIWGGNHAVAPEVVDAVRQMKAAAGGTRLGRANLNVCAMSSRTADEDDA